MPNEDKPVPQDSPTKPTRQERIERARRAYFEYVFGVRHWPKNEENA